MRYCLLRLMIHPWRDRFEPFHTTVNRGGFIMLHVPFVVPAIALFIVATIMPPASAQEPKLDGTWKSDWQLTKKHIDADCKLSEELVGGLQLMMGKMTVRYDGDSAAFTMPQLPLEKEGKTRLVEGWAFEAKLNFLGRTESQIALITESDEPFLDDSITLINFEGPDIYWVYLGHSSIADHHVREYFRRVPPKQPTPSGAE